MSPVNIASTIYGLNDSLTPAQSHEYLLAAGALAMVGVLLVEQHHLTRAYRLLVRLLGVPQSGAFRSRPQV